MIDFIPVITVAILLLILVTIRYKAVKRNFYTEERIDKRKEAVEQFIKEKSEYTLEGKVHLLDKKQFKILFDLVYFAVRVKEKNTAKTLFIETSSKDGWFSLLRKKPSEYVVTRIVRTGINGKQTIEKVER